MGSGSDGDVREGDILVVKGGGETGYWEMGLMVGRRDGGMGGSIKRARSEERREMVTNREGKDRWWGMTQGLKE